MIRGLGSPTIRTSNKYKHLLSDTMSVGDETREQQAKEDCFYCFKATLSCLVSNYSKNKSSAIILLCFTFINAQRCRNPRQKCLAHTLIQFLYSDR